jgi:hypothetical protein
MPYAVLNFNGLIESTSNSIHGAVDQAFSAGAREVLIDAAAEEERRETNPAEAKGAQGAARRLSLHPGGPALRTTSALEHMTLQEAYEELKPFFPVFWEPSKKGKLKKWPAKTQTALVKSLLGENAKTKKKEGHAENVHVKGQSLTPHHLFAEHVLGLDPDSPGGRYPDLCAGSSAACRHSCLVFAGQNYASSWAIQSKFQKTGAFLQKPDAYVRLLIEACASFQRSTLKDNEFVPMVRLNVLSDVPWEVVAPQIFAYFSGDLALTKQSGRKRVKDSALTRLQFYDYTKVPGRGRHISGFPSDYDITFSASGKNLRATQTALTQGTRVAVVAHLPTWERGAVTPRKRGESDEAYDKRKKAKIQRSWTARLPKSCSFGGATYPVIDGDQNDVRALDPAPSVIALRWKRPSGQASHLGTEAREISLKQKFIVHIEEFCGLIVGAVTPSDEPDTSEQTVFSTEPLIVAAENPSGRKIMATRRANPGLSADDLIKKLRF